ncbi:MAG: proline--tRNA ligase [Deltaproteobacteria bacterium]|nr:proline--tRNA ligase [Deltaproteobacteria bacterium]
MRYSRAFIPTLREAPADAEVVSHVYMVRGGYLRKVAAGIYDLLPLGWRVVRKIEEIVRQEMDRAGAQEILMPAAIPAELWQESGRWQKYGAELLRFKDRKGADFCIGPTHEEVVVDIVRRDIKSYRQLPHNLYQIQAKFRDEPRPRAGLMRGREFIMKDAYSFDASDDGAKATYQAMYDAYARIFKRCGLEFRAVEADTGNIGGSMSHEFQVLAETGEDAIVACDSCNYAANVEQAEVRRAAASGATAPAGAPEELATPGKRSIAEVTAFLGKPATALLKTLVYLADGKPVAAVVRGDHEVNEIKLRKAAGATEVVLAGEKTVATETGAPVGYVGPLGLKFPVFVDLDVEWGGSYVVGAGKVDAHLGGVVPARDLAGARQVDLRVAAAGDPCPRCSSGKFQAFKGIEVGHVFFLGTRYSAPMRCEFLDADGQTKPMVMGCYGIGITRIAAAAIEQNHDEGGIVWPMALAPYHIALLPLQKDGDVAAVAEALYAELTALGVEVLLDDRDERPGVKFKDAELLGMPLRVAIGKKTLAEGKLELKVRKGGAASKDVELLPVEGAAAALAARVKAALAAGQ